MQPKTGFYKLKNGLSVNYRSFKIGGNFNATLKINNETKFEAQYAEYLVREIS